MQKITPFLWFNDQAEEAMNFYVSIFKNSKITLLRRYGKEGPGPEGSVMTGSFQLEGQEFMALNGGPHFSFTPAISLFVDCKTQEEVDELWDKLSAGGAPNQCGWVQDKFGLSWQIIPTALGDMLGERTCLRSKRSRASTFSGWDARRGATPIARLWASAATPQTAREGACPSGWDEIGRLSHPAPCMGMSPCGVPGRPTHPDCIPTRPRLDRKQVL